MKAAMLSLANASAQISGVILNKVPPYQNYGYYHHRDGIDGSGEEARHSWGLRPFRPVAKVFKKAVSFARR